ncbi:hypothetical protein [Pelagibacterium montanilacus]|uniref:hypothetical protein n=1 Tax=Pelagibacterium montanilacus TaxID=2185280 RepID=UPI000F8EB73A|nr:hypothetical protein [Pelagibacterium montanilacus]
MPAISQLYFKTAIALLLVGIAMGLHMSISGNHNVVGAHAHINLLGWATSALFGAYLALNRAKATGRLPFIQYGIHVVGVLLMTGALYVYLQGNAAMEPLIAIGSILFALGAVIFAWIIFKPE